jgi:hypothetical protein
MSEDRNILIGELAARANLINPDQLALATSTWSSDKSISMIDVLQDRGFLDAAGRLKLERLVRQEIGDFLDLFEPGLSTLSAIDQRAGVATIATGVGPTEGPEATVAIDLSVMDTADIRGPVGVRASRATDTPGRISMRRGGSGRSGSPETATSAARSP